MELGSSANLLDRSMDPDTEQKKEFTNVQLMFDRSEGAIVAKLSTP